MSSQGVVSELNPGSNFKSWEEINEENKKNFPKLSNEEPREVSNEKQKKSEKDKIRILLEKKTFQFSQIERDNPWEKLENFRSRYALIKEKLELSKKNDKDTMMPHSKLISELKEFEDDTEVIIGKEEGKIDPTILLNRPKNLEMIKKFHNILKTEEGKGKSISIEYLKENNIIKRALITNIICADKELYEIESSIGREKKSGTYAFELNGYNMNTAVDFINREYQKIKPTLRLEDRNYLSLKEKWEKIANPIEARLSVEASIPQTNLTSILTSLPTQIITPSDRNLKQALTIHIQKVKLVDTLYDMFRDMMKHENLINKSDNMYKTFESVSKVAQKDSLSFDQMDEKIKQMEESNGKIKENIDRITKKIRDSFSDVHSKLSSVESKVQ